MRKEVQLRNAGAVHFIPLPANAFYRTLMYGAGRSSLISAGQELRLQGLCLLP